MFQDSFVYVGIGLGTDIRSAECVSDAHARQKALPHIQRLVRLPCRLAATGDGKLMIEYETFVLYSKE
jgi:hypothetical protein